MILQSINLNPFLRVFNASIHFVHVCLYLGHSLLKYFRDVSIETEHACRDAVCLFSLFVRIDDFWRSMPLCGVCNSRFFASSAVSTPVLMKCKCICVISPEWRLVITPLLSNNADAV